MIFEYSMLALMTLFFLFAWMPVSLAKYQAFGGKWLGSNREPVEGKSLAPWGQRAERAYNNLKDYFPAFAVTIILLGLTQRFDEATAYASAIYVGGRILHYLSYSLGSVKFRFISYVASMGANIFLLVKLF